MFSGGGNVIKKISFLILVGLFSWATAMSCYAQQTEGDQQLHRASGSVVSTDWVRGTMIVDTGGDEIAFLVSGNTDVFKGDENWSFADINPNDMVTVTYGTGSLAGLRAVRIDVQVNEQT